MSILVLQVYLSNHAAARLMMNHEYIVPMTDQTRKITLYPHTKSDENGGSDIPSSSLSTSLKPQMHFTCPSFIQSYEVQGDCTEEIDNTGSPEIPLAVLKDLTVEMLRAGVCAVSQDVRDPIGGNVELMLVPLIRLFYNLLVLGVFGDEDLGKVLRLIEPRVFSTNPPALDVEEEENASDDEKEWIGKHQKTDDTPKKGLLQMKLPDAVKLEVNKATSIHILSLLILHSRP